MSSQIIPINVRVKRMVPLRRDKVYDNRLFTGYLETRLETIDYLNIASGDYPSGITSRQLLKQILEIIMSYNESENVDALTNDLINLIRKTEYRIYTSFYHHIRIGGKPAVPGTSLKGAVRARLELLSHAANGWNISCFISASLPRRRLPPPRSQGWRYTRLWTNYGTYPEKRRSCKISDKVKDFENIRICKICDLFGNTGIIGRIFFGTFYAECNNCIKVLNTIFSCHKRRKGYIEAIVPHTIFKGAITFNGLTFNELGLLFIGLGLNGCPLLLGRFKYRWVPVCVDGDLSLVRFGRVKIDVEKIRFPYYMREKLEEQGIRFREDGIYLVVTDDARRFVDQAIQEAYNKYGMYLPGPNSPTKCEDEILNDILTGEKLRRLEECRDVC